MALHGSSLSFPRSSPLLMTQAPLTRSLHPEGFTHHEAGFPPELLTLTSPDSSCLGYKPFQHRLQQITSAPFNRPGQELMLENTCPRAQASHEVNTVCTSGVRLPPIAAASRGGAGALPLGGSGSASRGSRCFCSLLQRAVTLAGSQAPQCLITLARRRPGFSMVSACNLQDQPNPLCGPCVRRAASLRAARSTTIPAWAEIPGKRLRALFWHLTSMFLGGSCSSSWGELCNPGRQTAKPEFACL